MACPAGTFLNRSGQYALGGRSPPFLPAWLPCPHPVSLLLSRRSPSLFPPTPSSSLRSVKPLSSPVHGLSDSRWLTRGYAKPRAFQGVLPTQSHSQRRRRWQGPFSCGQGTRDVRPDSCFLHRILREGNPARWLPDGTCGFRTPRSPAAGVWKCPLPGTGGRRLLPPSQQPQWQTPGWQPVTRLPRRGRGLGGGHGQLWVTAGAGSPRT